MWSQALKLYSEKLYEDPVNIEYQKGKLRCLKNLNDWDNLSALVSQMWEQEQSNQIDSNQGKILSGFNHNQDQYLEIAQEGLESSWNLG